jgi:hypothetical protein
VLRDQAENELAFAPRVTCVDQAIDVFALDQPVQDFQPRLAFRDGMQIEMRRNNGEIGETPFSPFDFIFFRRRDLHEMADRRRKDEIVAFKVLVMLGKTAQSPRDVVRDGWLFGDDQCFGHD